MIELMRILVRTEKERLEADKKRDEQMKEMASQIKTILNLQQTGSSPTVLPPRPTQSRAPTYVDLVAAKSKNVGQKPTISLPAKDDLSMLRPGKAVIHSNPLNDQLDKLPKALFVQRANEALAKMNARVQDELVTVTGAHVMPSGDVVFYTKNRIHKKWLMENRHLWSKQVHADLEATPSAWSVLVHGIPKTFDPLSELSKSNLALANHLKKEDIVCIRWLSDNIHTAKKAGLIVLSLADKDVAKQITYSGIF